MKNTGKNAKNGERPGASHRRGMVALISVLLFLAVLGVFLPALHNGFVDYDDNVYVTKNAEVQQGLTWHNVGWAFHSMTAANWHPLTWLSHMLDCQIYGPKPWGHHLTSILLHSVNAVLVFWVLVQMTGAVWRSLFVAALFGLHPLHVESVAWVAERKDVLSAFFWLLTMITYVAYVKTRVAPNAKKKAIILYCVALLLFALGLMSKPMVVTLPFVLLLLDYWPLGRLERQGWVLPRRNRVNRQEDELKNIVACPLTPALSPDGGEGETTSVAGQLARRGWLNHLFYRADWISLVVEKTPFFLLTIAASSVTFIVQKTEGAVGSTAEFPWSTRVANAVVSYCAYLGKLLWPVNLSIFYPYAGHWPGLTVLAAGLLLVGITGLAIVMRRSSPWLPVGWLWFIGVLVPVIGLVQVGLQSMADRYTYVPAIGLFILISWGAYELTGSWPYRTVLLSVGGAVVIGICSTLTRQQLSYWKNSEALFRHAVAVTSNNGMAHSNLGYLLVRERRWDEAITELQAAVAVNFVIGETHNYLGAALRAKGRLDEAVAEFHEAIKLEPNLVTAYANLGDTLAQKGQIDAAIPQFQKALELDPKSDEIRCDLGMALVFKGEINQGVREFQTVLSADPNCAQAHFDLGFALESTGQTPEAISHYQRALELQPNYPGAKQRLMNLTHSQP